MAQFAIENLTFSYPTDPEHPSLKNVTLHVEQGEYIALCGKSGSGKTTAQSQKGNRFIALPTKKPRKAISSTHLQKRIYCLIQKTTQCMT